MGEAHAALQSEGEARMISEARVAVLEEELSVLRKRQAIDELLAADAVEADSVAREQRVVRAREQRKSLEFETMRRELVAARRQSHEAAALAMAAEQRHTSEVMQLRAHLARAQSDVQSAQGATTAALSKMAVDEERAAHAAKTMQMAVEAAQQQAAITHLKSERYRRQLADVTAELESLRAKAAPNRVLEDSMLQVSKPP